MTYIPSVLFVDDDPQILAGYQRILRADFRIQCASDVIHALELLSCDEPFDVVVSDLAMPDMNGIQFLQRARRLAPNSTRIMLTGKADLSLAMSALEQGHIFRFLLKPVSAETLRAALHAAAEQCRLLNAEQELLAKTLRGAVRVLTEILSTVAPELLGQAQTLRQNVRHLGQALKADSLWAIEMAALLSEVGMVTLPVDMVHKVRNDQQLSEAEQNVLRRMPEISANLIAHIPRLEPVAKIILYQDKTYDGAGFPDDAVKANDIPLGSRMLHLLKDMARIESLGKTRQAALALLRCDHAGYDPKLLEAALHVFCQFDPAPTGDDASFQVKLDQLLAGDILRGDILASDGTRLLTAGQVLTGTHLERIRNYSAIMGVKEPFYIQPRASAVPLGLAA